MKHQCDLSESDLRVRPNQIRHTILRLKQVHRTQYQNTYQLGPASSADLTDTVFDYTQTVNDQLVCDDDDDAGDGDDADG